MLKNKEIMSLARRRLSGHWGKAIGSLFAFLGIVIAYAVIIQTPLEKILGKDIAAIPDFALELLFITPMTLGFIVFYRKLTADGSEKIKDIFQPTLDLFNTDRRQFYWRNIRALLLTMVISIAVCIVCAIPTILLMPAGITDVNTEDTEAVVNCISQSGSTFFISVTIATVLFFVVFYHLIPWLYMCYYKLATDENIDAVPAIKWSWNIVKGSKFKYWGLSCRFIGWWILGCVTLGIGFLWIGAYMSAAYVIFADEIVKQNAPAADSVPADPAA